MTFNLGTGPSDTHNYTLTGADGFIVGSNDGASLRIEGGTVLAQGNQAFIAPSSNPVGSVIVSGAGARLETPATLRVAPSSGTEGSLTIEQGGVVESDRDDFTIAGFVGGGATSKGTVLIRDPGSEWILHSEFQHSRGEVELRIENGGVMRQEGGNTTVARRGNTFTGTITGAGSLWKTNTLMTGQNDLTNRTAIISIEDGGEIQSTLGRISWNGEIDSHILVTDNGSQWNVSGSDGILLGGNNIAPNRVGHLIVANQGEVNTPTLQILPGSSFSGDSLLTASDADGVVNLGGLVAPGLPESTEFGLSETIATLIIDGNYTQQIAVDNGDTFLGTLQIKIGGPASHDQLEVLGDVDLDGKLEITAFEDPVLSEGDTFQILAWTGDLSGTFSEIDAFDPGENLFWDFEDLYLDGTIAVIPEPGSAILLLTGWMVLMLYRRPCRALR